MPCPCSAQCSDNESLLKYSKGIIFLEGPIASKKALFIAMIQSVRQWQFAKLFQGIISHLQVNSFLYIHETIYSINFLTYMSNISIVYCGHLQLLTLFKRQMVAINSYPPIYMCRWTWPVFIKMMACRLDGTKTLSKPMMEYCKLDLCKQTSVKCQSKNKKLFFCKNASENIVCKMAAILSIWGRVMHKCICKLRHHCHLFSAKPLSEPMLISSMLIGPIGNTSQWHLSPNNEDFRGTSENVICKIL